MYEVLALIPESSDFTLERAVAHFKKLTFSRYRCGKCLFKKARVRAELATPKRKRKPSGFRVVYGDWGIDAWLDSGKDVLAESRDLAEEDDLPAQAEVIAACSQRLSVWSDEDPNLDYSDDITAYTDELRERFGMFIYDPVNGCWWT
jgi:hypothetical protein